MLSVELHLFAKAVDALVSNFNKAITLVCNLNKNDRKTEKKLVRSLNSVCDTLMFDTAGFRWLTHFVDFSDVLQSLRVVCVFDTDLALANATDKGLIQPIAGLVKTLLEKEGFVIPNVESLVFFDTEENGADVNVTRWCRKYAYKA